MSRVYQPDRPVIRIDYLGHGINIVDLVTSAMPSKCSAPKPGKTRAKVTNGRW
jgi:hypothetical protein